MKSLQFLAIGIYGKFISAVQSFCGFTTNFMSSNFYRKKRVKATKLMEDLPFKVDKEGGKVSLIFERKIDDDLVSAKGWLLMDLGVFMSKVSHLMLELEGK